MNNPNGSDEVVYRDTIPGIRYMDSVSFQLPIEALRDKGINKLTFTVDADNDVTLDDGVVVTRTGRVRRDGKEVELHDGEVVSKTGRFFDK